jgi:hypothetical protein
MEQDTEDSKHQLVPQDTPGDTSLDVAVIVTSAVPWLGGPVSAVLSGISFGRKYERVREVLNGVAEDLRQFKSSASEEYVRTEDFEELLEKTLRQTAEERSGEKRRIYRAFLTDAIASPGKPYEEQIRFLRALDELQPDHLRVIKALSLPPEGGSGISGSPLDTLYKRLPDIPSERIGDLILNLNDLRITAMTSLRTMMTFSGAQDLRHSISSYGARFLAFILKSEQ